MTPSVLLIVLLCMCDFSSVKKEILRIFLLAVEAVEVFSCLLEVLSGARKRKQGEISNAPCISRRIALLI
jgi:hypothetical protein